MKCLSCEKPVPVWMLEVVCASLCYQCWWYKRVMLTRESQRLLDPPAVLEVMDV
jgi:hypothetical protein